MTRPHYVEPWGYYEPCGYIEYDCMGETAYVVPGLGHRYEVPPRPPAFVVIPIKHEWLARPLDARYTVEPKGYRFTVPPLDTRYTVEPKSRRYATSADLRFTVRPRDTRYTVVIDRRYTVEPKGYRYIVTMENGMTTGTFWNIDAPNRPWGPLDEQSVLPIPIDWERWLAEIGKQYASHSLHPDPLLTVTDNKVEGGVIYVDVKFNAAPVIGQYYPLRCHIVTDGTTPSEEDQTLWFKAVLK